MDAQFLHIDFIVPKGWHELDDKQLRFVYYLIATDHTADEIKTLALLQWGGAKVVGKQRKGIYLLKQGKHLFEADIATIAELCRNLSWLDTLPTVPVRISRSHRHKAPPLHFIRFVLCPIQAEHFTFCRVSGLDGFEEALAAMQNATAFCCVSDIADGYTELNNSPCTRRVKTVFLAMRHAAEDMDARTECMEILRELFRQLMSVLILERTKLEQNHIYLDPRISFNEIDRYFYSGVLARTSK